MSAGPKPDPRCERCSHPQTDVEGFIIIHKGRPGTYLCYACIDDLKTIIEYARQQPFPEPLALNA